MFADFPLCCWCLPCVDFPPSFNAHWVVPASNTTFATAFVMFLRRFRCETEIGIERSVSSTLFTLPLCRLHCLKKRFPGRAYTKYHLSHCFRDRLATSFALQLKSEFNGALDKWKRWTISDELSEGCGSRDAEWEYDML